MSNKPWWQVAIDLDVPSDLKSRFKDVIDEVLPSGFVFDLMVKEDIALTEVRLAAKALFFKNHELFAVDQDLVNRISIELPVYISNKRFIDAEAGATETTSGGPISHRISEVHDAIYGKSESRAAMKRMMAISDILSKHNKVVDEVIKLMRATKPKWKPAVITKAVDEVIPPEALARLIIDPPHNAPVSASDILCGIDLAMSSGNVDFHLNPQMSLPIIVAMYQAAVKSGGNSMMDYYEELVNILENMGDDTVSYLLQSAAEETRRRYLLNRDDSIKQAKANLDAELHKLGRVTVTEELERIFNTQREGQ